MANGTLHSSMTNLMIRKIVVVSPLLRWWPVNSPLSLARPHSHILLVFVFLVCKKGSRSRDSFETGMLARERKSQLCSNKSLNLFSHSPLTMRRSSLSATARNRLFELPSRKKKHAIHIPKKKQKLQRLKIVLVGMRDGIHAAAAACCVVRERTRNNE